MKDIKNILIDTRAFANNFGKNNLIYYVNQIFSEKDMSAKVAEKLLINSIDHMLTRNNFLNFSVALNLSPSSKHYKILWDCLDFLLQSKDESELQWLVWPVIFVVGSNDKFVISSDIPLIEIQKLLDCNLHFKNLFLFNNLITPENFSKISVADWFNSKKDNIILDKIINSIKVEDLVFNLGQEVLLFYVLSYGDNKSKDILFNPLKELSLPLMQIWQQHFNKNKGLSIFVNPLSALTPSLAHSQGDYVKKQMQFDIFVSNAIRKIRFKNANPLVVIATIENGAIMILITTDNRKDNYKFIWNMSFIEDINNTLQDILNLFFECKVSNIKLLKNPLLTIDDILSFEDFDLVDIN